MDTASTTKSEGNAVNTWQEIESLVEELSELSRSPMPATSFYAELIDRAVGGSAGTAGAIWSVSSDQIELQYQTGLTRLPGLENELASAAHQRLLRQVSDEKQGAIYPPSSGPAGQAANPTAYFVVVCPIEVESRTVAVIEVLLAAEASPAAQRGCLELLKVLAELSSDFHRHWLIRQFRDRESTWSRFENFVERIHESTNVDQTAYTLVNEARSLIECDRVSVALRRGRKCRLAASSGVDVIDSRSTSARVLQDMARQVVASGQPIRFNADDPNSDSEPSANVRAYINESNVQELAVLPLAPPANDGDSQIGRPLGAIIVEQFKRRETTLPTHRIASVTRHGSAALNNAIEVRNLPLMPLVRLLAKLKWQLRLRRLPITLVILLLMGAGIGALILVPADFDIEGRGELQPVVRRNLYAPIDGDVTRLPPFEQHEEGESVLVKVEKDGLVVVLRNVQLEYEILRVGGELRTAESELETLRVSMGSGSSRTEEDRLRKREFSVRYKEIEAKIESLRKQLKKLHDREALLNVHSPIDGEVLTWNVEETLRSRPVLRGQKLMEIARTDGDWVLEMQVPEHDIGHVLDAQGEIKEELDVRFILKTDPGFEYEGTIEEIARAIDTNPTDGATVTVTIRFEASQIPNLRPGTQVIGKIHCGRRPLGYVWLHDLWDSIRQRVAF